MNKPHVAVLGAGRMGSAITTTLLAHGHAVTVWNRTRARAEPLAARGARIAEHVLEAATKADVLLGIVNDYPTFDAILAADGVARALRGKTIIQLASGSPAQARKSAEWARASKISFLAGAIMALPEQIGQPECLVLYAGEPALFEQHASWLRTIAGNSVHLGPDAGQASALDSALLMFFWSTLFGVLHGATIAEAEGIPLELYREHIGSLLPVAGGSVLELVDRARRRDFEHPSATIDTHFAALEHLRAICRARGIDRTIPDAFYALLETAKHAGDGQRDLSAVFPKLRR